MKIEDIRRVVIVGAGNMGQQIGTLCAIHEFEVVLYDISQDILERAFQRIRRLLRHFITSNEITEKDAEEAFSRMKGTTRMEEAASHADFISESVPEDPDLKKKIFSQFNALCPQRTIFTTNTSMILPSMLAEGSGRPDKLVALHFHNVRTTQIVDVMGHPGTSEETVDLVCQFAVKIGQIPITLRKESPGYVFNAMLTALFQAAHTLAANGVTSIEEIDRAWMGVTHMPIGPFGIMDSIGVDTVWKVTDYWADQLKDEQYAKNALFLRQYVDKGLLGQKTGQGFYSYPDPAYRKQEFVSRGIQK